MVTQLSILTAVLDGHASALRDAIGAIPIDDRSPFALMPGTHNGRWAVVSTEASTTNPLRAGGLPGPMMMCSAVIDVPVEKWVDDFVALLGPIADEVWSHCAGWPGRPDAAAKAAYLLAHRVTPMLSFATWDETVGTITAALATRERVERFAVRTQGLSAEQLLAAYRTEFPR
jgi:hypothetical protein